MVLLVCQRVFYSNNMEIDIDLFNGSVEGNIEIRFFDGFYGEMWGVPVDSPLHKPIHSHEDIMRIPQCRASLGRKRRKRVGTHTKRMACSYGLCGQLTS